MTENFKKALNEYMEVRKLQENFHSLRKITNGEIAEFNDSEIESISDGMAIIQSILAEKRRRFADELVLLSAYDDKWKNLQEKYVGVNYHDIYKNFSYNTYQTFFEFIENAIVNSEDYTKYSGEEVIPGFTNNFIESLKEKEYLS